MSLRLKLLLLGLLTLVLPWGGCRYARQMEAALREGEQNSLQAVAQTIAASLQGRTDLLYREDLGREEDPEAPASRGRRANPPKPRHEPQPSPYDLQPIMLSAPPFLDGYGDEWPRDAGLLAVLHIKSTNIDSEFSPACYERMLYVLLDVEDEHLVFDAPGASPLDPSALAIASGSDSRTRTDASASSSSPPPAPARSRRAASRRANTASSTR